MSDEGLRQVDIDRMLGDAEMLMHGKTAYAADCACHIKALTAEVERLKQENVILKQQRDDLFYAHDTLQCNMASALGWDTHGKTFGECVREMVQENIMLQQRWDSISPEIKEIWYREMATGERNPE